jgi:asparagine synthetase B (glutamine-hydrolysing)
MMCGIVGIYNDDVGNKVSSGLIERMLFKINHRGPDERGI